MSRNPYFNQDILGFLWVFIQRLGKLFSGQLGIQDMVADEVQMAVLAGIAVSSALVGTFLVLRRMTMLANALSHTILLGIVMAFLLSTSAVSQGNVQHLGQIDFQAMLIAAIVTGLATAFLTQFLTTTMGLQEDASVGLVFTSLFALGIILVTLFTRNAHIGTEAIMGNADALQVDDLYLVGIILAVNIAAVLLFYKELKITTFDPQLAQAMGVSAAVFNYLLMIQVSITSIGAFRAVGVIMVLAFITGPALSARLLTDRLGRCILLAVGLGVLASVLGVGLARHMLTVYDMPLSTSGLVVCVIALIFAAALVAKEMRAKEWSKKR